MNYRPVVTARPVGASYRADGLMFHMPGRWDLTFDVVAGAAAPNGSPARCSSSDAPRMRPARPGARRA